MSAVVLLVPTSGNFLLAFKICQKVLKCIIGSRLCLFIITLAAEINAGNAIPPYVFFNLQRKIGSGIYTMYTSTYVQRSADYVDHNNLLGEHVCEETGTNIHLPRPNASNPLRLPTNVFLHVL